MCARVKKVLLHPLDKNFVLTWELDGSREELGKIMKEFERKNM
jgi:hypothetical protein